MPKRTEVFRPWGGSIRDGFELCGYVCWKLNVGV